MTIREYDDPKRRTLILVYADGTIVADDPNQPDTSQPLRDYLTSNWYSPRDTEVPTHIYTSCSFCGDLHEVFLTDRYQEIDQGSDWVFVRWTLKAHIAPDHEEPFATIGIRIDGRA